jgi:S-adenosylmethionine:tRNA ribosyltransferase-isomerase
MRRADFHFELPAELIAQSPLPERSASRLLACDGASGELRDLGFRDLPQLLAPGDLLVFNDTRVLPARVRGRKPTGGVVEILLERIVAPRRFLAQARSSKGFRQGSVVELPGARRAVAIGRSADLHEFELDCDAAAFLQADSERYQTVYARKPGAVAAPTAGLHFDEEMFRALQRSGIEVAQLTLHVGAGTFQPVRVQDLAEHRMHPERIQVCAATVAAVDAVRRRGGRVVAVGTTVVRSLEAAALAGVLEPYEGETDIFITPGFRFRVVDALITNFQLPESTLLMLVSAFAGRERVLAAYRHAVAMGYRFFSYGDVMFLTPSPGALAPRRAS